MRTLTPTQKRTSPPSTRTPAAECVSVPVDIQGLAVLSAPSTCTSSPVHSSSSPLFSTPPNPMSPPVSPPLLDLLAQNTSLNIEVTDLRTQMKAILDHSIESDMRLLQYTTEVFATSTSSTASVRSSALPQVQDQCTQTVQSYDQVKQTPAPDDPLNYEPCKKCRILKEESMKMISTIRCLEEQIKSLQSPSTILQHACPKPTISQPSIPLSNPYDVLAALDNVTNDDSFTIVRKRNLRNNKRNNIKSFPKKTTVYKKRVLSVTNQLLQLPFRNVTISGDSHARHLSGLVKELVCPSTSVTGLCKPGAGLLSAAPSSSGPPPTSHCHVLLAGSNDVAVGNHEVIYKYLEPLIQSCSRTSRVVVSTLPHRHDLSPKSPVNNSILLINNYIAELCSRYEGVVVMDISDLRRSEFTSHGMHLRARGKRLLARLIAETLAGFQTPARHSAPSRPSQSTRPVTSRHATPDVVSSQEMWTLPHDSYAEAVKQSAPVVIQRDLASPEPAVNFLGQPHLVSSQRLKN